ncbi:MAG: biopolymer transporter ExbD [Bacteroidota bacterium]
MSRCRQLPEVNAGSMADIAFLLLIFFLVTASIPTDEGLRRRTPPLQDQTAEIKDKNLFEINLNQNSDLMVEGEVRLFSELKEAAKRFIDNGGILPGNSGFCSYCGGAREAHLSDNPQKAIIALGVAREADYTVYVTVQNELQGAYNELRNTAAMELFGSTYEEMKKQYTTAGVLPERKKVLRSRIKKIQEMYPQKIVETTITNF